MENKFRNEMEITIGGEKILLRPTFENIAAMESDLGGVAYLGWKLSRGMRLKEGKVSVDPAEGAKALPSLTEAAKIFYYNQAATNPSDATQKKFSLDEIWDLVLKEGASVSGMVMKFLMLVTAGDKSQEVSEVTETEKKG